MSGPMSWRRRVVFAACLAAAVAIIAAAALTADHALSQAVTVTVCGHSYSVAAGSSLDMSGSPCTDTGKGPQP